MKMYEEIERKIKERKEIEREAADRKHAAKPRRNTGAWLTAAMIMPAATGTAYVLTANKYRD